MASYPYKPLDLSKQEIRILKILSSTTPQRGNLVHCSLQHVSLDDLAPSFKAFLDEMEFYIGQPVTYSYATTNWMIKNSDASESEPVSVRQQVSEPGDNLHLPTQPSIAYWRYEAETSERENLMDILSIDASALPRGPSTTVLKLGCETISQCSIKPQTYKIKPRFAWGDFESLSYCWESDIREKDVVVDGILVRIPKNLEALLQKLRNLPEAKSGMGFWVDGLCIDQDNTLEKNHQVLLMQRIYSQSFATIVWLGSSFEGSNQAMDLMAQIAEIECQDKSTFNIDSWLKRVPWEDVYAVLSRNYWKRMWIIQEMALNTHRTLFLCGDRQLPRAAIELTCLFCFNSHAGDISKVLANQGDDAQTRPAITEYDTWRTADDVYKLLRLKEGDIIYQKPGLETVLDLARKAKVKDPRDKIYGLLGLLPPSLSSRIQPNYSWSKEEVYIHFARSLLERSESVDEVLSWCSFAPGTSFLSRVSHWLWPFTSLVADWEGIYSSWYTYVVGDMLPSWVPDWTKPFTRRHLQWLRKSSASGEMKLPFTTKGHKLHCKGILVDSVQSASFSPIQTRPYRTVSRPEYTLPSQEASFGRYADKNGLADALNQTLIMSHPGRKQASLLDIYWIDWDQLIDPDYGDDSQMEALWTYGMAELTLTESHMTFNPWESFDRFRQRNADFMVFGHPFKFFFPNMRTYRPKSYPKATSLPSEDLIQRKRDPQNLTEHHARNVRLTAVGLEGRKLVTTTTGFLGLAPEAVQKGDVVAVVFGCNFPVVLRPFGKFFKYIGECYVEGLMSGEAIYALERGECQAVDITLC